jgi:membrane protein
MATGVERIFNDIWRTDAKRPLWRRLIMFYTLATLVPALIGVSLYHAAHYGLTNGVLGALGAMFATTAGLLLANKWLPRTHVRWIPAIVGALVSAFLFEIAKHLFRVYVAKLAWNKYFGIYGAIGLLPITLLWIYYSWVVTLFGAEVAYAIQHLDHLELLDRRARHIEHEIDRVNPQVAARLLCMVAVERRAGRAPTRGDLARRFDLSVDVAERVLRRLVARRLLGRDEETDPPSYLLARKESEITLWDVWGAFRSADVIAPGVRAMSRAPLDQALTQVDQALSERLRGITLEMLATQAPAAPVLPEEARDETDDEAADA